MKVRKMNMMYNKLNMMPSDELQVLVFEEQNKHECLNLDNASKQQYD
jgi:hypothetical protein